ncbi:MAG: RNA methyltransferase [Flavobacteriaceae bacterium]
MALSKNNYKLIKALQTKKGRQKSKLFMVEGRKSTDEFIRQNHYVLHRLFVLDDAHYLEVDPHKLEIISPEELKSISNLNNPDDCVALFELSKETQVVHEGLILALDQINDPGNLGTIIRLCDWFGVNQLWCSKNTVDCFNPKVVQSTMGSLSRVELVYTDLLAEISTTDLPVYITEMDGEDIYNSSLPKQAIIVMGNEANGVGVELKNQIDKHLSIPRFGQAQKTESLNVAMATGIVLAEFNRQANYSKVKLK